MVLVQYLCIVCIVGCVWDNNKVLVQPHSVYFSRSVAVHC